MIDTRSPMRETKKAFENSWLSVALGSFLWNVYIIGFLVVLCVLGAFIVYTIRPTDFQEEYLYDIIILAMALSVVGPFSTGYVRFLLEVMKRKNSDLSLLFSGLKDFGKTFMIGFYCWAISFGSVVAYLGLVVLLHIISPAATDNLFFRILVVIAGSWFLISVHLRIMWIPYFINEEEGCSLSAWGIVKKSWNLMEGNTLGLFLLLLRFIGWNIIAIITLGIGWFWVYPYTVGSIYFYYLAVKKNKVEASVNPVNQFKRDTNGDTQYAEWSIDRTVTVLFIVVFWTLFLGLAFIQL